MDLYTVHVPTAGGYKVDDRYAAAGAGAAIRIGVGGSDVTATSRSTPRAEAGAPPRSRPRVTLRAGVQALQLSIAGAANTFQLDPIGCQRG